MIQQAFFHPRSRYNKSRAHEKPADKAYGFFWARDEMECAGPEQLAGLLVIGDGVEMGEEPVITAAVVCVESIQHLRIEALVWGFAGKPCRLLVLHPRVLEHLHTACTDLAPYAIGWDTIKAVVGDRFLDHGANVAEILAGVPDFDGIVDEKGDVKFPRYKVPETAQDIHLQGCYFALVVDNRK